MANEVICSWASPAPGPPLILSLTLPGPAVSPRSLSSMPTNSYLHFPPVHVSGSCFSSILHSLSLLPIFPHTEKLEAWQVGCYGAWLQNPDTWEGPLGEHWRVVEHPTEAIGGLGWGVG